MSKDLKEQLLANRKRARAQRRKRERTRPSATPTISVLTVFIGVMILVVSVLMTSVIDPWGSYQLQRAQAVTLKQELEVLQNEKYELDTAIKRLESDAEVIRVARRDFNLVFPGEKAYAFRTPKEKPVALPSSWPFSVLYDEVID